MKFESRAQLEFIKEYYPKAYLKSIDEYGRNYFKSLPLIVKKDYKFIKSMISSQMKMPILKSK